MQLIGEALLLAVLTSINTTKVRSTRDVTAAPVEPIPLSSSLNASAQRFLIHNNRYSTPRPSVSISGGESSSGWFRNTLAVYSRIKPRVTRDAKQGEGNSFDQDTISLETKERELPGAMDLNNGIRIAGIEIDEKRRHKQNYIIRVV